MSKLSIIVPVYFNEENLPTTIPALLQLREKLAGADLELVFVDDGSKDRSLEILLQARQENPEIIKVVALTRNFGTMSGLRAGMQVATGDCVGMISADLQDPPELFVEMFNQWQRGVKTVIAVRGDRHDPVGVKLFASLYYILLRKFALPNYPQGGFDFFLIDREVVQTLVGIEEKNTNLMSLIFWLGYPYVTLPYTRQMRDKGRSRWTMSKKIKLFIDTFVSFSYVPIRMASLLGFTYALASMCYLGVVLYNYFTLQIPVQGWTTLVIIITFTFGLQMLVLGVLGEYLWRTLDEVRKRPSYIALQDPELKQKLSRS